MANGCLSEGATEKTQVKESDSAQSGLGKGRTGGSHPNGNGLGMVEHVLRVSAGQKGRACTQCVCTP